VTEAYSAFTAALAQAVHDGEAAEDISRGHSLMQNDAARAQQLRMASLAESNLATIRKVLAESMYPEQRAVAAYVMQYAPEKAAVVPDLQVALRDPDSSVRRNAARSLTAIALLGRRESSLGIRVQPTWFIELLNSAALSDRQEGVRAMLAFTDQADENTMTNLKLRALASLFEMARWQHLPDALPAFLLLGRVAGWKDDATQEAWSSGERDKTVDQWRKSLKGADKPVEIKVRPDKQTMVPLKQPGN
jgi:hypothetical protein